MTKQYLSHTVLLAFKKKNGQKTVAEKDLSWWVWGFTQVHVLPSPQNMGWLKEIREIHKTNSKFFPFHCFPCWREGKNADRNLFLPSGTLEFSYHRLKSLERKAKISDFKVILKLHKGWWCWSCQRDNSWKKFPKVHS